MCPVETEILIVGAGLAGAAAAVQLGFAAGHLLRELVADGMLDRLARRNNNESFQRAIHWIVGAALAGSTSQEALAAYGDRESRVG